MSKRIYERGLLHGTAARLRGAGVCLAQPQLRRLQISWLGFNTADMAVTVALGVYAFEIGGAGAVGLITLARTLPAIISAPLFSVVTDRLSRRSVLGIGYWGRAVATGAIALALATGSPLWVVYLLAAVDIILASSVYPASAALIPDLSPKAEVLSSANAVFSMMENLGLLIGPLLAAGLIAFGGVEAVFAATVLIYALGALAIRTLTTDRTIGSLHGVRVLHEVREGLATLRRHWDARIVVIVWTIESMLVGVLDVCVVVVALEVLGWGDPGVGLLMAVLGVGGIFGSASLASASTNRPYAMVLLIAIVGFGLGMAGAAVPVVAVVVLGMVITGVALSRADVAAQTLLQRTTPQDSLGRVLGTFEGLYWAAVGVGAFLGSLIIDAIGPISALIVFACSAVAVALSFLVPLRRIDAEARVAHDKVAACARCSLFGALPVATVEYLANHARERRFGTGEVVLREGAVGDDFYVVVDGEVTVNVTGREMAILGPGDYFGEIALLYDVPRTATVTSVTDVVALSFDGPTFVAAVTGYLGSTEMVGAVADARIEENERRRQVD